MVKKVKGLTTERKIFIPNMTLKHKANYSEKHVETLCQHYDNVIENGFSVSMIMLESNMTAIQISKDCIPYCFIRFNDKGESYICKYNDKAKGEKVTLRSHLANEKWYECDVEKVATFLQGV